MSSVAACRVHVMLYDYTDAVIQGQHGSSQVSAEVVWAARAWSTVVGNDGDAIHIASLSRKSAIKQRVCQLGQRVFEYYCWTRSSRKSLLQRRLLVIRPRQSSVYVHGMAASASRPPGVLAVGGGLAVS